MKRANSDLTAARRAEPEAPAPRINRPNAIDTTQANARSHAHPIPTPLPAA
jgi:hypothetical protein